MTRTVALMPPKARAVLAASLLWTLTLAAPAQATFPGVNGKIAYCSSL